MSIQTIEINFSTKAATDALQRLAQATLKRPELLEGIAKIQEPLFTSCAENRTFEDITKNVITVVLEPSDPFRRFLQALDSLDGRDTQPRR